MSGPGAVVLTTERITETMIARLATVLAPVAEVVAVSENSIEFVTDNPYCDGWIEIQHPCEAITVADAQKIQAAFGCMPIGGLQIDMVCSGSEQHKVLGAVTLTVAKSVGGLIDFLGAIRPANLPSASLALLSPMDWAPFAEPFAQFAQDMPGKIISLPYTLHTGQTWVSHVCDCAFMSAWLERPDFHMVK